MLNVALLINIKIADCTDTKVLALIYFVQALFFITTVLYLYILYLKLRSQRHTGITVFDTLALGLKGVDALWTLVTGTS